ncbi:MAG: CpsD/CapB family tyrosine-protein kinase [Phycisphaeraceae bacterium]
MGHIFEAISRADQGQAPTSRPQGNTLPPAAARPAHDADRPELAVAADQDASWPNSLVFSAAIGQTDPKVVDDRLLVLREPVSVPAEEYRAIRTGILARWQNKRHLIHTITSATPQEGKTITSLNLGLSFAELRTRRTLVIEADLRLPQFKSLLKLPESPGLVGLLNGEAPLAAVVQAVGENHLHVIQAGKCSGVQPVQLLSSPMMTDLLATLRRQYDHVIIDTPPVVELADAGILGAQSDDVLLIARMQMTPRSLIDQAMRTLASYNAPVAGMIATDQPADHGRYAKYSYKYRYRYQRRAAA